MTTFLVAFSSVALGSILPCPAHSLDSDSPINEEKQAQAEQQRRTGNSEPLRRQI